MEKSLNFPRADYKTDKPWNPTIMYCGECGEVIYSKRPGHYKECGCGESFVDETREYGRMGGSALPIPKDEE